MLKIFDPVLRKYRDATREELRAHRQMAQDRQAREGGTAAEQSRLGACGSYEPRGGGAEIPGPTGLFGAVDGVAAICGVKQQGESDGLRTPDSSSSHMGSGDGLTCGERSSDPGEPCPSSGMADPESPVYKALLNKVSKDGDFSAWDVMSLAQLGSELVKGTVILRIAPVMGLLAEVLRLRTRLGEKDECGHRTVGTSVSSIGAGIRMGIDMGSGKDMSERILFPRETGSSEVPEQHRDLPEALRPKTPDWAKKKKG